MNILGCSKYFVLLFFFSYTAYMLFILRLFIIAQNAGSDCVSDVFHGLQCRRLAQDDSLSGVTVLEGDFYCIRNNYTRQV